MPSNRDLILFLYGTTFVILLSAVSALPPDFFRNGRSKPPRMVAGKRSGGSLMEDPELINIVSIACDYCQTHTQIPQLSIECQTNTNIRQMCLGGYLKTVKYVVDALSETWE